MEFQPVYSFVVGIFKCVEFSPLSVELNLVSVAFQLSQVIEADIMWMKRVEGYAVIGM